MNFKVLRTTLYVTTALGAWHAVAAQAQNTAAADVEEIVVTGTMIRGVAPVGSNVLSLSRQDIEASGAMNTQQILAEMPQASTFNNLTASLPAGGVISSNSRVPVARPNIRNLPCAGGASGTCTLILIDGHRVVSEGIQQVAVDPAVIPPGIIERVETIVDGNSAIYGSDAVGGVVNFITKKSLDGAQVDAHYGVADPYTTVDTNLTYGKTWERGSFLASYSFGKHDALYGKDRDYVKGIIWTLTTTPLPTGQVVGSGSSLTCDVPNVAVAGVTYNGQTLAPGGTYCDLSKFSELYPEEIRHNGYVVFKQDVTDTIKFNLSAFYTNNKQTASGGPLTAPGNASQGNPQFSITTRNPYYQQIPGTAAGATQTVNLSFGPIFGNNSAFNKTNFSTGQVTPEVTIDIGDWQVRTLGSWGKSNTSYDNSLINSGLATLYTAGPTGSATAFPISAAINPYNLAATQNTALFGSLRFQDRGNGIHEFLNFRAIADGKVFALPGGDVHAAIGVEYYRDKFKTRTTNATTTDLNPFVGVSQNAKSVFGEVTIPLVDKGNSMAGIERLTLSASGRYDKYEGLGGKFDPKFGLTYEPIDWVSVRANWGKSFNAPNTADLAGALPQVQLIRLSPLSAALAGVFTPAGTTLLPGANALLILTGTAAGIKPQSSTNWAIGTDIRPPVVPNLTLSGTYYHILFKDLLGLPTVAGNQAPLFNNYPNLFMFNQNGLPLSVINAFALNAPNSGPAAVASAAASGTRIVEYIDGRTTNLGLATISGIDFDIRYSMPTSFGSIDARFSGNYQLKREQKYAVASPVEDTLVTNSIPPMNFQFALGATVGKLRGQATWNHTSGANLFPNVSLLATQTTADSFDAINLFFRYDIDGSGLAKDLNVTLSVNNAFDASPPIYRQNGGTGVVGNIRTLGRLVQFGVSKKF